MSILQTQQKCAVFRSKTPQLKQYRINILATYHQYTSMFTRPKGTDRQFLKSFLVQNLITPDFWKISDILFQDLSIFEIMILTINYIFVNLIENYLLDFSLHIHFFFKKHTIETTNQSFFALKQICSEYIIKCSMQENCLTQFSTTN